MPPKGDNDVIAQLDRMTLSDPAPASAASSGDAKPMPALSQKDRTTIQTCFNVLKELIEKLNSEVEDPLSSTVVIDATRLSEYSDVFSHALTKFVVFVSQGEAGVLPSQSEEVANHLTSISCLLRSMLATGPDGVVAGPTRRSQLVALHRSILSGARGIFAQLESHCLAKKSTVVDVSLIARAWDVLEKQLKSAPLTNATAVGRGINHQCSVLKDARSELDTVHIATEEEAKKSEAAEEEDDEFDDDDDFDDAGGDAALTAAEYAVVPSVEHLVSTGAALVKTLYMYILKVRIDERESANVEWLESVLKQVQSLGMRVDDLIESVYAPQDRQAVLDAVAAITNDLRAHAGSIVRHNLASGAEWPVKSAAADAAPAAASPFAGCAACEQCVADAAALVPTPDAQHTARLEWLSKCVAQIHEGHKMAETC